MKISGWDLVSVLSASLALGCSLTAVQADTVRGMYAREFQCGQKTVKIDEIGGGRYRARGCDRMAMYQCTKELTCFPDERSTAAAQSAPAPSAPQAEAHVDKSSKGGTLVALDTRLDDRVMLKLRGLPEAKHDLQLKIVTSAQDKSLESCDVSLLLNGARMDLPKGKFEHDQEAQSLRVDAAPTLLKELAVAQKLALKTCDFRWSLSREATAEVRHFAELYQQELAWAAPATSRSTGGLIAPSEGWPAWTAAAPAASADAGPVLDGPALFKLLSPSVFKVVVSESGATVQGSGVAISKTQLLTNCHVLEGAQKINVLQGKQELPATISSADPASDRCVLTAANGSFTPVHGIRPQSSLQVGEPLYTLGSPNGLDLTLSNGILSGMREEEGQSYVQTSAPISPGSSGGGLFDARGNLVGITELSLVGRENRNQSLNFAIPAELYGKP